MWRMEAAQGIHQAQQGVQHEAKWESPEERAVREAQADARDEIERWHRLLIAVQGLRGVPFACAAIPAAIAQVMVDRFHARGYETRIQPSFTDEYRMVAVWLSQQGGV